jgi:hypothetical protein
VQLSSMLRDNLLSKGLRCEIVSALNFNSLSLSVGNFIVTSGRVGSDSNISC